MLDLAPLNATLRGLGLRLSVEQLNQALYARGTFPQPDGSRRRSRVALGLRATPSVLAEAQLRCLQLNAAIAAGTYPPALPWAPAAPPSSGRGSAEGAPLSCGAAIRRFEVSYWEARPRTSAAERTWDRIALELRRLPEGAPCTLRQLVATITAATQPGTRTRLESCKVYKRLAKLLALPGNLDDISRLQGHYEPARRALPTDPEIEALLDALRPTPWGWCYAALATFGCRPAEVPSLQLHADGTAQCLTVKRRNRAPAVRTCFALPRAWVDRYALGGKPALPGGARWLSPEDYDSAQAKRFVDAWRHSRRTKAQRAVFAALAPEFDLYDLRHRWAVRSIEAGLPLTLCARALGHSAAVHEQTYHSHIQASDLRAAMAVASA
ncbi:hypothetical protein KBZ20_06335 [Vulcanococcus limneticus Candia 3F8]|uniref:hypothetical protein n=1 Tax=Vulcanococcus limneticus TaxID=2170428 RepID=UPI000B99C5AE|nr:hypothetical protein [Vulcanococcus limneticus]MCP9791455.1 hypothetical protein [Vulcanococcus limneticus MW73D5]MCP9893388.1 hypothetical protein [Vulcanococcus limneticus Candia 3F8]MCP9896756.1 hypothetical protein [Vulcanococcus limneticus Candia 3B3]